MFSLICSQRKEKSIAPNCSRSLSDIVLGCKIDRPCPHRMAVYSIEHCQSELKRLERSVIKLHRWEANTTLWVSHYQTIASTPPLQWPPHFVGPEIVPALPTASYLQSLAIITSSCDCPWGFCTSLYSSIIMWVQRVFLSSRGCENWSQMQNTLWKSSNMVLEKQYLKRAFWLARPHSPLCDICPKFSAFFVHPSLLRII